MEPNEMEVWDLGKGMGEWERSRVNPDGKWVRYSDAMQIITALQAQIDGMIKRPTVDEVGDEEDCWWFYERRCYIRAKGSEIREDWEEGEQWLPLSALPKGDV